MSTSAKSARAITEEATAHCATCGADRAATGLTPGCVACLEVLDDVLGLVKIAVPDAQTQHWTEQQVDDVERWAMWQFLKTHDPEFALRVPPLPKVLEPFRIGSA